MRYNIKHLTERHQELYYQKAVPKKLQAAVGKTVVKQKLGLRIGTPASSVAAKIAEIDERYTEWFRTLTNDNRTVLNEIEKRKAALAFLQQQGLAEGDLAPLSNGTPSELKGHQEYINSQQDVFELGKLNSKIESNEPLTQQELVIEYAWTLATAPATATTPAMFSDAWKFYSETKGFDKAIRRELKNYQFWDRFIAISGDNPITTQTIYDAQRCYAEHQLKEKVQPQSIVRSLTPILAAFRSYVEENQLSVNVIRYKVKQEGSIKERKGISEKALVDLWKLVTTDQTIRDDVRLALLLAMQSSLIGSELQRLKVEDLIIEGCNEYEGVSWLRVKDGKTADRTRPVPLVAGLDLIKELLPTVSGNGYVFANLSGRSESSMSFQLGNVIKRIDDNLTAYSLRHGWLDRCYNADVPESFQDRVGGWSGGNKSKKRGYARLADTSIERLRVYEGHQRKVNRCLLVDRSAKIVELNTA